MTRKTLLALAVAGAFGLSTFVAHADEDKKDAPKPELIASGDEVYPIETQTPELLADEDKKDAPKPELVA